MQARIWTPEMDAEIERRRMDHETFRVIGAHFGVNEGAAYNRARYTGILARCNKAWAETKSAALAVENVSKRRSVPWDDGQPLPAGHPISWGVLNAGLISMQGVSFA